MNNVQSKAGIVPVPSPTTLSTTYMKRLSEYCLLIVFLCLIMMGCGPRPRFTSATPEERKSRDMAEEQSAKEGKGKIDKTKMGRIINSFLGAPYQYGGDTKSGMDCSGLVVQVYRKYAGFSLPRSAKKLYQLVKQIHQDDLAYGDLVFFSDGWFSVSHVGIYIDDGQFVHSAKSSGVIVSSLDEKYYKRRYRGARRVIP
ncbi:MAG: C40 family peptidase [Candidatus Zixiibacteriota bacterium]|nr:MAG: C40 family peptidase [candidate division Zixibacteria bacterium]